MKRAIQYLSVLFVLCCMMSCQQRQTYTWSTDQKISIGDSIAWSLPTFQDSLWEEYTDVPVDSVCWVRLAVHLPERLLPTNNLGILIGAIGSYEAYWDGVKVGSNGQLASPTAEEIPGAYHQFYLLPSEAVSAGDHVLAMRTTIIDPKLRQHAYAIIGDYFNLLRSPLQISKYMFLFAGIFLIIAIYLFLSFINSRKDYAALVFGFVCLIFFSLVMMEYLKLFYQYPYPFQRTRLETINLFHILLTFLVPLYFLIQFSIPRKKIILGVIFLSVVLLENFFYHEFDTVARFLNIAMWTFSVFIVGVALYQKKKGAWIALITLVLSILMIFFMPRFENIHVSSFDISLFIAFSLIVVSMLYILTLRRKEEQQLYELALLRSERLKNELLKKNIKPHFIMNTLTSLIDWVEESPKKGVHFIKALASEFEVLNEIADKQLVPIGQEINLCKRHLEIMGYRKEINYIWKEQSIDMNEIIPPAIIHTAVENGITHSLPLDGSITFILSFEKSNRDKQYTLETIANKRDQNQFSEVKDGTGFKYIKARLQESYGDRWELDSFATNKGWKVTIKIKQP